MLVSDNDVKVVVQMQQCTFFFFKVRMCVTAVVGKTHLQRVLLSAQRRETAVRTRGCTDKSPEVLGGGGGVVWVFHMSFHNSSFGKTFTGLSAYTSQHFLRLFSFFLYRFGSAFRVCTGGTLSSLLALHNGFHNWNVEHNLVWFFI